MTRNSPRDLSPVLPFSQPDRCFELACGLRVQASIRPCPPERLDRLIPQLDHQRGVLFSCGVDAPGRYRRQRLAMINPPLMVVIRQRAVEIKALNQRGEIILSALRPAFPEAVAGAQQIALIAPQQDHLGSEETRTRRPSVFTVLRRLMAALASPHDPLLGLYGAFGYDLTFALEDIPRHLPRPHDQRDLVLYLPDRLLRHDPASGLAEEVCYEFAFGAGQDERQTDGLPRNGAFFALPDSDRSVIRADHGQGDYAGQVARAQELFARGDLFELVLSQTFSRPTRLRPSEVYQRLTRANPAPYEALISLGDGEHLVSASPEMFVRVRQDGPQQVVETCPISGTIRRGADALGDADQCLTLLNSAKDHAELTMCTDVDRNDKARVCQPGSVRVTGRRMIELYSRLIHTVDHVQGVLRPDMDALDAFLTHTWAVTVTGAPKLHAMRQVEAMERSSRRWYGGAFGVVRCDGSLETGLTLRTVRLAAGVAEVRVGATLLYDSDPQAEQDECVLKASALMAILDQSATDATTARSPVPLPGQGRRLLLVDHEDSFVLTLADYLRQSGAEVVTLRPDPARQALRDTPQAYDLVVLSPGPGKPSDFGLSATLALAEQAGLSVFGVCLGLQGMVEYYGGSLRQLAVPMHGKASLIHHRGEALFAGLPQPLAVGRYHSLAADHLPDVLTAIAHSDDGTVMAIAHRTRPLWAVQFHPESILTAQEDHGLQMIRTLWELVAAHSVRRVWLEKIPSRWVHLRRHICLKYKMLENFK